MFQKNSEGGGTRQNDTAGGNTQGLNTLIQENATESNAIQIPGISLPQGGGALKGIDEKFEVNAANGTAAFNIPLPITPGRNEFSPSLSLSYNSGAGNSPYGLGWSVGYLAIQRKTDKRLPRYRDGIDEDIFMFSGAEDLVPFLYEDTPGNWQPQERQEGDYRIKRFRPRIEGGFARIERISHSIHGVYWKVTTRENVTTFFGRTVGARIADPEDDTRIFKWLPEFSYDDKGNWIEYEFKEENLDNVPNKLYEKNRKNRIARFTNQYLKRIRYGNRIPWYAVPTTPYDQQAPVDNEHFFEIVFDYGEHDALIPLPGEETGREWDYRTDAFSNYRAGFEIRTNRLCKRVLMFHHFKDEPEFGENVLVRSLDFKYEPSSINQSGKTEVTYLQSVIQRGYIRKPGGSYSRKSLPPMEFDYQQLNWDNTIKTVSRENIVNAPVGLTNNYQWVDLYGEGISGILTEQGGGWFYKSNLGDVEENGDVSFTPAKEVIPKPSFTGITSGTLSIRDLEANGQKQVVVNSPGLQGYFQLTEVFPGGSRIADDWQPFQPFQHIANINLQDPNVRSIDLDGDGQPELVVTEENVVVWYPADGKKGYSPAEFAAKTFDEEKGPAIVFADQTQSIFMADMSGDGLTDIVRIRSGEICYWANKGYGRFSAKVNMSQAPLFDHPDQFNPQYLHLADVSGTGATDIIYLGKNRFKAYINLSGNAWSDGHEIDPFFPIDGNTQLSVIDLLGTGTSSIVWSSDLPGFAGAPMRYIDLMGGKKPHVLVHYKNNSGKETTLEYKSSTHFYLEDKRAGKPWITRLPFPVQVIGKQIIEDKITGARFSAEYRYHHGYYDHPEREFRGFGMVEQLDTEFYEDWRANNEGNHMEASQALFQAPVLTKTWFHTGAFLDRERILTHFKEEYWYEEYNRTFPADPLTVTEPELPDATINPVSGSTLNPVSGSTLNPVSGPTLNPVSGSTHIHQLSAAEWPEALRACKGMVLRREVFAMDAPAENDNNKTFKPYSAATHNCNIQLLQPREGNAHGVFLVTESEAISIQYERDETDPRIAHTLNTKIDELGNILETASVVYPRLQPDPALPKETRDEQAKTLITYTRNTLTNDVMQANAYRLRVMGETETFELSEFPKSEHLYRPADFNGVFGEGVKPIDYQINLDIAPVPFPGKPKRRLIEHIRTLYYRDNLNGPLPLGELESTGIPFESYQLAYTPNLLTAIYGDKIADQDAAMTQGKFHKMDGNWWIPSGTVQLMDTGETVGTARSRFYSPIAYTDPFDSKTEVSHYGDYFLFIEETRDALQNMTKVEQFNFRTLAPRQMRDMNDNLSQVMVDELGLVKAVALQGKDLDNDGEPELEPADNLLDLEEITENEVLDIQAFFQTGDSVELDSLGRNLLQGATSRFVYDFDRYKTIDDENKKHIKNNQPGLVKPLPPTAVASINREEHHGKNPDGKLQFRFEYSDGLGNVAMVKAQAEPGMAKQVLVNADGGYTISEIDTSKKTPPRLRWLGNGRTVLNNKGKPVKQYEPYFSVTPFYEEAKELVERGVTPVLFYDSPGRLIKTQLPDKTFTKVEFDAWKQVSYDQNDTIKDSPWYDDRINHLTDIEDELSAARKDPVKEKEAAEKAGKHHGTPSAVHLDTLGRPILSIEHNRDLEDNDEFYNTIIQQDIEGNARTVIDAKGKRVMEYTYDMLGHRVYQKSMDAGERWMFNNVMGNPVRQWDSRDHSFYFSYDKLQRPTQMKVEGGDRKNENGIIVPLDNIYQKIIYGEGRVDDKKKNLRGQVFQLYDTGGLIETPEYDFKGQPLSTTRRLFEHYKTVVNWIDDLSTDLEEDLEEDLFTFITETDALGRITRQTAPDGSIITPSYNETGLLNGETVAHIDPDITTTYINDIDYDEKGQRRRIEYGNKVVTEFKYDPLTFRLIHLNTTRSTGSNPLQDLSYTYDPVGNIMHIRDEAQQKIFFGNIEVKPHCHYQYDALNRLIFAEGREHAAQHNSQRDHDDFKLDIGIPFPNSPEALQTYTEEYRYDSVGNILSVKHDGGNIERWTRNYQYASDSNRLLGTSLPGDGADVHSARYDYDAHGNMMKMPHLTVMQWDFTDQLQATSRQEINNGTPETTYYQYDGQGQRIRKITENKTDVDSTAGKKDERIYIDGYELYKKHSGKDSGLERTSLSLMDEGHRFVMIETRIDVTEKRLVRYQLHNHLGSASLELDDSDNTKVISYEEYHPYGTTAYQAKNAAIKSTAKRYRNTGTERDEENGFNYHGARYYTPWLGRWGSADPIGIEGGINIFMYAEDNPIRFVDMTGLKSSGKSAKPVSQTQAHYSKFAFFEAGIDPSQWQSSKGFEKNRSNVEKVYEYYTTLYERDERLLWAGMAKLAGGEVLRGLNEIQREIDNTKFIRQLPKMEPGDKSAATAGFVEGYTQSLQNRLLQMQKDIFLDMAWQHQAYQSEGLKALEKAFREGADVNLNAWRDIDSRDPFRVRRGNRELLMREQKVILQPHYDAIKAIRDFDQIPLLMSKKALSPIPGGEKFKAVVPGGDITTFKDRWRWIDSNMLPAYENLSRSRRTQLIFTPLTTLAERKFQKPSP